MCEASEREFVNRFFCHKSLGTIRTETLVSRPLNESFYVLSTSWIV